MRRIERTGQFKRDYRRVRRGPHRATLDTVLVEVLESLVEDRPLEPRHRDHPLAGEWHDHRDCHLRSDLVLIYRKSGEDVLQLVRLGSHSELGL